MLRLTKPLTSQLMELVQNLLRYIESQSQLMYLSKLENHSSTLTPMNPQNKPDTVETRACVVRNPNPNLREPAKSRGAPSSIDRCDHCKKQSHNRDSCWHLHPHLRPNREREEKGSGAAGVPNGEEEEKYEGSVWVLQIGSEPAPKRDEITYYSYLKGGPYYSNMDRLIKTNGSDLF